MASEHRPDDSERHRRVAAFGDAIGPLEAMIEMLRVHGPTTVLPGLESILHVCRVAFTEPGSVDEASQRLTGIRRAISRPMSDLVIVADTGAELTARNERFEALKEQLSAALVRTDPPDRIKQ